jgi:acetate kinase
MTDAILAVNAGSSSLKFALFEIGSDGNTLPVFRGLLEGIGTDPHFTARSGDGTVLTERRWPKHELHTHETLLGALLDWVDDHLGADRLIAIGHRIVHGGAALAEPLRLSDRIIEVLEALTPLAPLHQPHSLAPVRAINALRPGLPQIACFDTAFHHTIPALATRFGLPPSPMKRRAFGATDFTVSPTTISPGGSGSRHRTLPRGGSSWRILATAPASARCRMGEASTPPWALRRWTG